MNKENDNSIKKSNVESPMPMVASKSPEKNTDNDAPELNIPKIPWTKDICRFGMIIISVFLGALFLWGYFAPIESAAVAPGKVIVAGYRRTVEHLEGGIVKAIHVKEGSVVKKGQVLIEMDDTRPSITVNVVQNELYGLLAMEARLLAERDHAQRLRFSHRLLTHQHIPKVLQIIQGQESIFNANQKAFQGDINILQKRITQLEKQIHGIKAQQKSNQRQLVLIKQEVTSAIYLEKRRLIEKRRLLALQREQARLEGQKGEQHARLALMQQRIGETQLQISAVKAKQRKEVVTELRAVQEALTKKYQQEKAAMDVLKRTKIRASQTGRIVALKVHTVGEVVSPGENLMDIVPSEENLIIEVKLNPLDIDVVHPGLIARASLTAFKQRSTPTLSGEVIHISADAFSDQRTGESYYLVRIKIPPTELKKLKGRALHPGMPAQVMIITNKLSPLEYLISPIKDSFNRAFRED